MTEPASPTPTPRKNIRKVRVPRPRGVPQQRLGGEESEENDKELEGLLGVIDSGIKGKEETIGGKGVLAISKADIEASSGLSAKTSNGTPSRQGVRTRSQRNPPLQSNTQSESDTDPLRSITPRARQPPKARNPKSIPNPAKDQIVSNLSAQLSAHPSPTPRNGIPTSTLKASGSTTSAYDVSSLSRSLPSDTVFTAPSSGTPKGRRKKKGVVDSGDESKIWDEPSDPGPSVVEDMTVSIIHTILGIILKLWFSGNKDLHHILMPNLSHRMVLQYLDRHHQQLKF